MGDRFNLITTGFSSPPPLRSVRYRPARILREPRVALKTKQREKGWKRCPAYEEGLLRSPRQQEKLANKLFGVSFVPLFWLATVASRESFCAIRKAGHVLAIHLGRSSVRINIFFSTLSFSAYAAPYGWLMVFSLIFENWCECGECDTAGARRDRRIRNWPSAVEYQSWTDHFTFQRTRNGVARNVRVGMIIVLRSPKKGELDRVRWSVEGFFMNFLFSLYLLGSSLSWFPEWIGRKMFMNSSWAAAVFSPRSAIRH